MKAILMQKTGTPDVLTLQETPTPVLNSPTDVLVKLKAASVNPLDTKLRSGKYPTDPLPTILGCDGAGIVQERGEQVTAVNPGDEVYFFYGGLSGIPGNYAEYIVLDQRFLSLKPASLDFIHAAAAPLVLITAWESLFDRCRLEEDDTVLVHAGAGGVGHVAIQLAKHAGARVIATVGSEEKAKFVSELGADETINYQNEDFVDATLKLTEGAGADIVMDNVGGEVFEKSIAATRIYGDLVTLVLAPDTADWPTARMKNLRISYEAMIAPLLFNLEEAQTHQTWILDECSKLFDAGKLNIHIENSYPLAEASKAHQAIETGRTRGKLVLSID